MTPLEQAERDAFFAGGPHFRELGAEDKRGLMLVFSVIVAWSGLLFAAGWFAREVWG